jgi:heme-degrading monooxygenase HmoA
VFARVSRFEANAPGDIDESVRIARERVLPVARELEGFKGIIGLADRATGNSLAITLWGTEEALRASEAHANDLRRETLVGQARIAGVERYEVTMFEVEAATPAIT